MEINNKQSPRERLVRTATETIYKNGFDATSVNDLIQISGTHKASFYRYFKSKEEIGDLYLTEQGQSFLSGWKSLMDKSKSPEQFVTIWISLLKRQMRRNAYFGCPIARFMSSSEKSSESPKIAKRMIESWVLALADFLFSFMGKDQLQDRHVQIRESAEEKAKQFIKIFQANSQLFVITHEISFMEEMETEMLELLKE